MSDPLPLPRTPPDAVRTVVRERVIVGEREFLIERPSGSDDLLDHPAVRAAFAADEYLPYWADLWPAARVLAQAVLAGPLAAALRAELERLGWPCTTKVARAGEPGGQRYRGTLYRIARPAGAA